jgi:quinol monooxygenase YgiN
MSTITCKKIIFVFMLSLSLSGINAQQKMADEQLMVRIAEIEIVPECSNEYKKILIEEAAASIKIEAGVIAIFPMVELQNADQIRIVEIYANKQAYESHLKTPHFQHYKTLTVKMVKSLKLVEMDALDKQTMLQIFKKLK